MSLKLFQRLPLLCVAALAFALSMHAQEAQDNQANEDSQPKDFEGCSDSPVLGRNAGSILRYCELRDVGQATMPLGNNEDGQFVEKTIEGQYGYWDYSVPEGLADTELFADLEAMLGEAGFTVDYSEPPIRITAHKEHTWCLLQNNNVYYSQTIVQVPEMQRELPHDAAGFAREINKNGHVAVYGLVFETDTPNLIAGSEDALTQILKLLKENPDLKIRIDGHTDDVGNAEVDKRLSEKRAQSIVAWLVAQGVAQSRLSAKGRGQNDPVEDNTTEEGRARNNRFELVKQ